MIKNNDDNKIIYLQFLKSNKSVKHHVYEKKIINSIYHSFFSKIKKLIKINISHL